MVFIPKWAKYRDRKPPGLPELNYSNGLALGLVDFLLPTSTGIYSLNTQQKAATQTVVPVIDPDAIHGACFNSTTDQVSFAIPAQANAEHTLIASCSTPSAATAKYPLGFGTSTGNGAVAIRFHQTGVLRIYVVDSAGATAINSGSVAYAADTKYTMGLTSRSGDHRLFRDGVQIMSSVTTLTYGAHDRVTLGGFLTGGTPNVSGDQKLWYGMFFNRILSAAEMKELHEAPYQLLKQRLQYFDFGGTPAATAKTLGALGVG